MAAHEYIGLEKSFKLRSSLSTNNMPGGAVSPSTDEFYYIIIDFSVCGSASANCLCGLR